MDEDRLSYIRNLWSEEIYQLRRFVGSKNLAKILMIAYIIMVITLLIMIFVLVGSIIARHTYADDEHDEDANHANPGMKSVDYSDDISGFLYLAILFIMVGCVLCCRPCSLCKVTSPHYSGYEEI